MTFNEKITTFFTSPFSIRKPSEPKNELQYYADYIELVSIVSCDYISQDYIKDRLLDEGESFEVDEIADGEIGSTDAQKYDKLESFVNQCFSYVKLRSSQYLESYPFLYDDTMGLKMIDKEDLTQKQKLYIYLLISSSIGDFRMFTKDLTDDFEILSENALKNYLPISAKVYGFGANSRFTGNTQNKIKELAKILKVDMNDRLIDQIAPKNSKEEGLDIVGYIPFDDEIPNTFIIFGQCACGKNWAEKQSEAKRYGRFYIPYINPFSYALFLPRDFLIENYKFRQDKDIADDQIIFERRRLINLSDENIIESLINSATIVKNCISYTEDLV